jgi:hypothetical protein
VGAEVAPAASAAWPWREHVVSAGAGGREETLVRVSALGRDLFGATELPGQRLVGVFPAEDKTAWQVVELDSSARPTHHPLRR